MILKVGLLVSQGKTEKLDLSAITVEPLTLAALNFGIYVQ